MEASAIEIKAMSVIMPPNSHQDITFVLVKHLLVDYTLDLGLILIKSLLVLRDHLRGNGTFGHRNCILGRNGSEIKVFDVHGHEAGIGCQDGAVNEEFGCG